MVEAVCRDEVLHVLDSNWGLCSSGGICARRAGAQRGGVTGPSRCQEKGTRSQSRGACVPAAARAARATSCGAYLGAKGPPQWPARSRTAGR